MLKVQPASLDWALAHVFRHGDTDVFPVPFEFRAIEYDWSKIRKELSETDLTTWQVRPHRSILAPKARYGFRLITQLDPLDFIIFAATTRELAADLEAHRVPTSDETVFSFRFSPTSDGQIFDPAFGYNAFNRCAQKILSNSDTITHVATADIADFYPRIYLHRLENALRAATGHASHVRVIMNLLSSWNGNESFGIPVGNAPCRLLAEMTISDVDQALLARGIEFIRFNDDYRIFSASHEEAYRSLAFLADILFRNHGLSLSLKKTTILTRGSFQERFLRSHGEREVASLQEKFHELIDELGLGSPYEPIDYDDLDDDQKKKLDSLNLVQLFRDEVEAEEPDLPTVRFVLNRLGQLGDETVLDEVLASLDSLYPSFPEVIRYLQGLDLLPQQKARVGKRILSVVQEESILSELDYHRMWAFELFSRSTEWDNEEQFFQLFLGAGDEFCRRKLVLAMGRAKQRHWFQSNWRNLFDFPHWTRRAFLAGASCLAPDARRHYYRSVEPRLELLESAVVKWAKNSPFA